MSEHKTTDPSPAMEQVYSLLFRPLHDIIFASTPEEMRAAGRMLAAALAKKEASSER